MCGLLDSAVCSGDVRPASASCTSDAVRHGACSRVGLSSAVACDQRSTRLQRSACHHLQLLRVQDSPSPGQL